MSFVVAPPNPLARAAILRGPPTTKSGMLFADRRSANCIIFLQCSRNAQERSGMQAPNDHTCPLRPKVRVIFPAKRLKRQIFRLRCERCPFLDEIPHEGLPIRRLSVPALGSKR